MATRITVDTKLQCGDIVRRWGKVLGIVVKHEKFLGKPGFYAFNDSPGDKKFIKEHGVDWYTRYHINDLAKDKAEIITVSELRAMYNQEPSSELKVLLEMKNLFVPLNKASFQDFKRGKIFELRRAEKNFSKKQIYKDRGVTISCGYSGERFYGTIGHVVFGSLSTIFKSIHFKNIEPLAKSIAQAKRMNAQLLGEAKEYVAFEIIKDGR